MSSHEFMLAPLKPVVRFSSSLRDADIVFKDFDEFILHTFIECVDVINLIFIFISKKEANLSSAKINSSCIIHARDSLRREN